MFIITDKNWEKIKEEYIKNKKNGILYEYMEEPINSSKVVENRENDENSSSLLEMLDDIVEYE